MQRPFEEVVTEHAATVLRVCRAALGPGPDADDAWSETFLSAFAAWPDVAEGTNVQAWLVRIAQRKTIDLLRHRARQPVPSDLLPEPDPPQEPDRELWRTVAGLPERQRLALAYHYFGGLTYVETARVIGGTAEAVRRAGADGLRTLRSRLGAEPAPPTRGTVS